MCAFEPIGGVAKVFRELRSLFCRHVVIHAIGQVVFAQSRKLQRNLLAS
jgi:hypothetical protein